MFPTEPASVNHQKVAEKWLWPSRSEDHHWTMKRVPQMAWPMTPAMSQPRAMPPVHSRPSGERISTATAAQSPTMPAGTGPSPRPVDPPCSLWPIHKFRT